MTNYEIAIYSKFVDEVGKAINTLADKGHAAIDANDRNTTYTIIGQMQGLNLARDILQSIINSGY